LKKYLAARKVAFHSNETVQGFEKSGGKVSAVITKTGRIPAEKVILCGGAWSAELAQMLGFKLPMMGGKGIVFCRKPTPNPTGSHPDRNEGGGKSLWGNGTFWRNHGNSRNR
jgi:D-amino-acid dehydrogenase